MMRARVRRAAQHLAARRIESVQPVPGRKPDMLAVEGDAIHIRTRDAPERVTLTAHRRLQVGKARIDHGEVGSKRRQQGERGAEAAARAELLQRAR